MACNRCSLLCPSDGIECEKCEKWYHYGCTDIPAYFILHLEEIENFHYICEECVLTAYKEAHGRIAKIESSIKKQQKIGTRDGDADNDQAGLKDDSIVNEVEIENKVPTSTENENKNKFPPDPQGAQPNGNRDNSKKTGDVDNDDNKNKTVCRYYSAGKCQHGRVGSDCRYSHPKMCRKYIKCGYNNNGCTRGANCKFFHPKLCHNSVDFFKCDKVYCNYYHLVGTLRPNSGNTVNNNDQFVDSQKEGHTDGDNMINNYERFTPNNNSGNYHSNAQQLVDDQNGVGTNSSQQIQNNSAFSGAQASNQQPVVNNDHNGQRINEALNSFLGYIKQLDQKMTHMEAQYNQCIQMQQKFWGPQQMRWFPPQMSHQAYNLA